MNRQTLEQIKQQRAAKMDAQSQLITLAQNEKRDFTEDEQTSFDEIEEDIKKLDTRILNAERIVQAAERNAAAAGAPTSDGEEAEKQKMKRRFSYRAAIAAIAEGRELEGVEKEINDIAVEEARRSGIDTSGSRSFMVPASFVRANVQTVAEDNGEYGGNLVGQDEVKTFAPLLPKLKIEDLGATVLNGLVGDVPLASLAPFGFTWANEDEDVGTQKSKVEGEVLKPKRLSANVGISERLLLQTNDVADQLITSNLQLGAQSAFLKGIISGDGVKAPKGLMSLITTNVAADGGAPTFNKIVELEGLVDDSNADSEMNAYLMNNKLKSILKTTKKDAGSGRFLLEGNDLNGYKYLASSLMEALSDGAGGFTYPLIFGDFSKLIIGMWSGAKIKVNPYIEGGKDNVVLHINLYGNSAVSHEKAFAINKLLTLS